MSTDHGEATPEPGHGEGGDSELDPVIEFGRFTTFEGSSSDDLPPVSRESLQLCFHFLAEKLAFPFEGVCTNLGEGKAGLPSNILVVALMEPGENWQTDGLLCRVVANGEKIELPLKDVLVTGASETRTMLEGYVEWFRERPATPADIVPFRQKVFTYSTQAPFKFPVGKAFLVLGSAGAFFGFLLGSLLGAIQLARISASLGAALFGTLGMLGAFRIQAAVKKSAPSIWRRLASIFYIGLASACIGGLAGAVVVAFVGIFCGAIVGGILGSIVRRGPASLGGGVLLGSILGPVILAFYVDRASALYWGMHAAWIGALLGIGLVLLGLSATRR